MLKHGFLLLIIAMLASPSAYAVEALSSDELLSHCDKWEDPGAEEDRIFCLRYIQGFIDGAIATDERVMRNVVREMGGETDGKESYSERAKRTRIGSRLERFGATAYADYCLGDPVPLSEVVQHVVEDAQDPEMAKKMPLARELVYQSLRTHYPCSSVN